MKYERSNGVYSSVMLLCLWSVFVDFVVKMNFFEISSLVFAVISLTILVITSVRLLIF